MNDELQTINAQISSCVDEIEYLESVLLSTSGPADDIIESLNKNREFLRALRHQYSMLLKDVLHECA